MRIMSLLAAGVALAACTTGPVTVPRDQVLYEVPSAGGSTLGVSRGPVVQQGVGAPAPAEDFVGRIDRVLAEGDGGPAAGPLVPVPEVTARSQGTPLDDDRLNLNEYTLEQQRIDAAIAERQLEAARQQLVIVQPDGTVPQAVQGVNIALFANETTHSVGEKRYSRPLTAALNRGGACRRFATADEAQRFFLANGGPQRDPQGLDPDGDGFACGWNPEPFRRLRL